MYGGAGSPTVLPDIEIMLTLLRGLNIRPRALPETHEILAGLGQLYGRPMVSVSTVPTPAVVPSRPTRVVEDLRLSVTAFFARVPWEKSRPAQKSPTPPVVTRHTPAGPMMAAAQRGIVLPPAPVAVRHHGRSDLRVSVQAFFAAVPWAASPASARPGTPSATRVPLQRSRA